MIQTYIVILFFKFNIKIFKYYYNLQYIHYVKNKHLSILLKFNQAHYFTIQLKTPNQTKPLKILL